MVSLQKFLLLSFTGSLWFRVLDVVTRSSGKVSVTLIITVAITYRHISHLLSQLCSLSTPHVYTEPGAHTSRFRLSFLPLTSVVLLFLLYVLTQLMFIAIHSRLQTYSTRESSMPVCLMELLLTRLNERGRDVALMEGDLLIRLRSDCDLDLENKPWVQAGSLNVPL